MFIDAQNFVLEDGVGEHEPLQHTGEQYAEQKSVEQDEVKEDNAFAFRLDDRRHVSEVEISKPNHHGDDAEDHRPFDEGLPCKTQEQRTGLHRLVLALWVVLETLPACSHEQHGDGC